MATDHLQDTMNGTIGHFWTDLSDAYNWDDSTDGYVRLVDNADFHIDTLRTKQYLAEFGADDVLDGADVEGLIHHVKEHGYGYHPAVQLVLIANPLDFDASLMSSWRAGIEYRAGQAPKWDSGL